MKVMWFLTLRKLLIVKQQQLFRRPGIKAG